jgi:hypothetical protein
MEYTKAPKTTWSVAGYDRLDIDTQSQIRAMGCLADDIILAAYATNSRPFGDALYSLIQNRIDSIIEESTGVQSYRIMQTFAA